MFTLGDVDIAIVWQRLAYTLRDESFFYNTIEAIGHFGVHNSLVLFLLLPLYAIWPDQWAII